MLLEKRSEKTNRVITYWKAEPVKLLVGQLQLPTVYTKTGDVAKRQPKPLDIGDIAYVKLKDGHIVIYPFEMAGLGYELVNDAIEGVHYEFV